MKIKQTSTQDTVFVARLDAFEAQIIGVFRRKADAVAACYQDYQDRGHHDATRMTPLADSQVAIEGSNGDYYFITQETVK